MFEERAGARYIGVRLRLVDRGEFVHVHVRCVTKQSNYSSKVRTVSLCECPRGNTPLHYAVMNRSMDTIKFLLRKKVSLTTIQLSILDTLCILMYMYAWSHMYLMEMCGVWRQSIQLKCTYSGHVN